MVKTREEHALIILERHEDGLSKSQLARHLYGEVTGSTQALISRLTKHLAAEGYIEESKIGRKVIVRLSSAGRKMLVQGRQRESYEIGSWSDIVARLSRIERGSSSESEEHPWERPLVYLNIAARLSAQRLVARQGQKEHKGDVEFGRALIAIIDPHGDGERKSDSRISNSQLDSSLFAKLSATWPSVDADRLGIVESILRFQDPNDGREGLAADLLRLGTRLEPGHPDCLLWLSIAVPEATRIGISKSTKGDEGGEPAIRNALFEIIQRHINKVSHFKGAELFLVRYQKGRIARALARMSQAMNEWLSSAQLALEQPDNTGTSQIIRMASSVNAQLAALDTDEWRAVDALIRRWSDAGDFIYERGGVSVRDAVVWALENKETLALHWYAAIEDLTRRNHADYRRVFNSLSTNFKFAGIEHRRRICTYVHDGPEDQELIKQCQAHPSKSGEAKIDDFVKSVLNNNTTTPMIWGAIAADVKLEELKQAS